QRSPVTAARLTAASLGCIVFLTLLAVCPLPAWWNWHTPEITKSSLDLPIGEPAIEMKTAQSARPLSSQEDKRARPGWPLAALSDLVPRVARTMREPVDNPGRWPSVVAAVFLAGTGLGLIRLLVGLWSVGYYRGRARPITDGDILGLVKDLQREMGCLRRIDLLESEELNGPATAGWLRPVVLLPSDWGSWDAADRRAVLAHEAAA